MTEVNKAENINNRGGGHSPWPIIEIIQSRDMFLSILFKLLLNYKRARNKQLAALATTTATEKKK